jgi:hypothetical protein
MQLLRNFHCRNFYALRGRRAISDVTGGKTAMDDADANTVFKQMDHLFRGKKAQVDHFFRGRKSQMDHLFRGKKAQMDHLFRGKKVPMDHLFRGKKAQMDHLFRGKKAQMDHLFRGKKESSPRLVPGPNPWASWALGPVGQVHRVDTRGHFDHLFRGKKSLEEEADLDEAEAVARDALDDRDEDEDDDSDEVLTAY